MVLILELRDLLKTTFLLVQTLKQVQGDGGIEVPELAEGWPLSLVEGWSLRLVEGPGKRCPVVSTNATPRPHSLATVVHFGIC